MNRALSIATRIAANAPLAMIDQYIGSLKRHRAIAMDIGTSDSLLPANQELNRALTRLAVGHTYEEYEGDHTNRIAERLETAGHETWCVGGALRDNLLGVPNHDFDLTTAATPDVVRKLFKRTVPVGIEHGTVAVLDDAGTPHEVTTFRRDIQTDGRHAVVQFGVSLMDDLARRDFTVNAIAYHPLRHEWRDPFHGATDLARKQIRAVGDPNWRFQEDYLRILRALRFAAQFDFRVHPRTLDADLDTGSHGTFVPALIREDEEMLWFEGRHLGESFKCGDIDFLILGNHDVHFAGARLAVEHNRAGGVIEAGELRRQAEVAVREAREGVGAVDHEGLRRGQRGQRDGSAGGEQEGGGELAECVHGMTPIGIGTWLG